MSDDTLLQTFSAMRAAHNESPHLVRMGRLFTRTVLVEVDSTELYLHFDRGRLDEVRAGPSRRTPWAFALRTDADALRRFWEPLPAPGFHDLFGLVKIGRGRIDGDILLLVKNLRFFKEFMALGRRAADAPAGSGS